MSPQGMSAGPQRVLLVRPGYHSKATPLGLGYLSAYLKAHTACDVRLYDHNLSPSPSTEGYLRAVESFRPDVIGIGMTCQDVQDARALVPSLRSVTSAPIVIGGPHVTSMREQAIEDTGADIAVMGEGEETLAAIVGALADGRDLSGVQGVIYRRMTGEIVVNPDRDPISDLDALPMVDWDAIAPEKYGARTPDGGLFARIITSRGCPYKCKFCASPSIWKRRIHFRSPDSVFEEIQYLVRAHGVKTVEIADDNFSFDLARAERILELIIDSGMRVTLDCGGGLRADRISRKFLRKLKQAGCRRVAIGIESGSQRVLDDVNKGESLETIEKAIGLIKEVGFSLNGFFILGLPTEEIEDIKQTIRFACRVNLDRAWFNIFTPYPGSFYFKEWIERRQVDPTRIDWSKFNSNTPVGASKIPSRVLERYAKIAFLRFYARPRIILSYIRSSGLRGLPSLARQGKSLMGRLCRRAV